MSETEEAREGGLYMVVIFFFMPWGNFRPFVYLCRGWRDIMKARPYQLKNSTMRRILNTCTSKYVNIYISDTKNAVCDSVPSVVRGCDSFDERSEEVNEDIRRC